MSDASDRESLLGGIELSDAIVAGAAFIIAASTAALTATQRGEDPFTVAAAATLAAQSLPLLARRRHPVAVWFAVGVLAAVYGLAHWSDPVLPVPAMVALASLFEWGRRRTAIALLVLTSIVVVVVTAQIDDSDALDWGVLVLMLVISPVVGELLRTRRDELAALERRNSALRAEQEHEVEAARLAERQRIARELHDVVTHNVTMLVVQAEAAASVPTMSDGDRVTALDSMAAGGRVALAELRQLLGVLRDPDDGPPSGPAPGIAGAAELVERAQRTGLDVEFHGPRRSAPLPAAVDLAAYRVIQEGLTNVVRHASARHATVAVEVGVDALVITIDDDGVGGDGDGDGVDGVGLTGLRERMRLLDGKLEAGPRAVGGFRLSARIPLGAVP